MLLILFVTAALGAVGFLDDYLKVVKKKPKGLIGQYKIVGQVGVGLVIGSIIYLAPHWIDPDLWKLNTSTTVPFFKIMELDFGVLYVPMVVFVITATSNAVNLTDGLDGLAIGLVGIVALTLAVISYISGNIDPERVPDDPVSPRERRAGDLLRGARRGGALGFLWFNAIRRRCSWATPDRWRWAVRSARSAC